MAGEVAAISVAGQQHGLVVSDEAGRTLRPAILWNDTRSAPDAEALVADLGPAWWASEIGSVPVASFTVTSWAWLRRTEPEVARSVASLCLPHDWLTGQLCGRVVTDRGDASGTGWWSVPQARYHPLVLDHPLVEVDPHVAAAGARARRAGRHRHPSAASRRSGCAPACWWDRAPATTWARPWAWPSSRGAAVLSLGTSGTVYAVTERAAADPTGVVAGFADATGRFLPLACTLNATLAVDRFATWLGLDRDDIAPSSGTAVVVPFLDGERTPDLPDATGSVLGLTHATTRQEVLRSAYEGAVVSLLDALDGIDGIEGPAARDRPLVLVGGGARGRRGERWWVAFSGRPIELPRTEEAVALGAAVQAAACLTGEPLAHVARRFGGRTGTRCSRRWTETTRRSTRHRLAHRQLPPRRWATFAAAPRGQRRGRGRWRG